MKVLHITYDMRIGGTEMVLKNIIEGNTASDIEMSIFCIEAPLGPWGEELRESGVQIAIHERKPGFDLSLIKALRQHIKASNSDVVHCHQYTPWVYGAIAAAFTKAKVIFTEHGRFYPDSSSLKRKFVNPLLLKLTEHVTAISKATKQALVDYEFIPANAIQVVYNGIQPLTVDEAECRRFREILTLRDKTIVFGTIARLDPIKNQRMMSAAFARLLNTHPGAALIIVGDGEERASLEKQGTELGIADSVRFTGYINNPANVLGIMDVFLLSSLSEGTSMTLLEAMSLKKPCIVTDAGGNKEIIQHNKNGGVTNNNDEDDFASKMQLIADNQAKLLFEMGEIAFCIFSDKFHSLVMIKEYKRIWTSSLEKGKYNNY